MDLKTDGAFRYKTQRSKTIDSDLQSNKAYTDADKNSEDYEELNKIHKDEDGAGWKLVEAIIFKESAHVIKNL